MAIEDTPLKGGVSLLFCLVGCLAISDVAETAGGTPFKFFNVYQMKSIRLQNSVKVKRGVAISATQSKKLIVTLVTKLNIAQTMKKPITVCRKIASQRTICNNFSFYVSHS
ncbi:MAG: hypothetical protein F9K23_11535 [Bacteroidetes bacterium]|nr:MAG: hypothetical protein F9K23_11535 [Bacteroidota bacterium]